MDNTFPDRRLPHLPKYNALFDIIRNFELRCGKVLTVLNSKSPEEGVCVCGGRGVLPDRKESE